jgi:hypothetical protein
MATRGQYLGLVMPGAPAPIAFQLPDEGSALDSKICAPQSDSTVLPNNLSGEDRGFAFCKVPSLTFAERFPRLTIAMIGLALLVVSVNVEIDCLRSAGFHWN